MSPRKFAKIVPIKEVINTNMTLRNYRFADSVFGQSIYVTATLNDTQEDIIFTTGSIAIVELFKVFDEPDDVAGMQVVIKERGKSYLIETLED